MNDLSALFGNPAIAAGSMAQPIPDYGLPPGVDPQALVSPAPGYGIPPGIDPQALLQPAAPNPFASVSPDGLASLMKQYPELMGLLQQPQPAPAAPMPIVDPMAGAVAPAPIVGLEQLY